MQDLKNIDFIRKVKELIYNKWISQIAFLQFTIIVKYVRIRVDQQNLV